VRANRPGNASFAGACRASSDRLRIAQAQGAGHGCADVGGAEGDLDAGDEGDDGPLRVGLNVSGCLGLVAAADLADQDDAGGVDLRG